MKKIYSIKNNVVFTRMYTKGKSVALPTVVVYVRKNPSLLHSELGITTAKKLGGAVERNRARRLIRESWRLLCKENEQLYTIPYYVVIVARSRCFKKYMKMPIVKQDIQSALNELGIVEKKKEEEI